MEQCGSDAIAMGEPLISVRRLAKVYAMEAYSVTAISDVSMDITRGEFVAIMGPSGSGKTTFMNLLGCLDTPTSGEYFLGGDKVSGLGRRALAAIRNERIGFVFQTFNLLPRTSAIENVELPLLYSATSRRERRDRALAKLAQMGLEERIDHHPTQLSGGQQQRVAIARALVNDPLLILADEPTGALDSRTSLELMGLFQALNREGMTIVVVTHDTDVAAFASRVIGFRDGRVVSDRGAQPVDARMAWKRQECQGAAA
jgi:putative ABC transport system ATP-binding protein